MQPLLHYALEAHGTAATLYLNGTLDSSEAVRALRSCCNLPTRVRRLRVDIGDVRAIGTGALDTPTILLERWRSSRDGVVDVVPPRAVVCLWARRPNAPPVRSTSTPPATHSASGLAL